MVMKTKPASSMKMDGLWSGVGTFSTSAARMSVLVSCLIACLWGVIGTDSTLSTNATAAASAGDEAADAIAEDFWQWRRYESPEYGIKYGIFDQAERLEEFTEEAFVRRKNNATAFLQRAEEIPQEGLSKQSRISLKILQDLLQTYIDGFPFRKFSAYNAADLLQWDWNASIGRLRKETEEDYEVLLKRYQALPKQVDQTIVLMEESVRLGLTLHESSLQGIIQFLETEVVDHQHMEEPQSWVTSSFFKPFTDIPNTINYRQRLRIVKAGMEAVTNLVKPSLARLQQFLIHQYLPKSRPDIGVSSLPNGRAFYQQILKWHLSVDITAEEIHELGLKEVARIQKEIDKIVQNFGHKDLHAFITFANNDSSHFYNTEEEIDVACHEVMDEARAKLPLILGKIPKAEVEIYLQSNPYSPLGYYIEPTLDGSRPGMFYVNAFVPRLKFGLTALALHEAIPGHHTQAAYAIEEDIPFFRRAIEYRHRFAIPFNWPFYTAYAEGWALYAELLGEDLDIYSDPYQLFGKYTSEMFRAARLVVDTGIHAFGWSAEEARQFLMNTTIMPDLIVQFEVDRYIAIPGQACAYKIGELKIRELRGKAEAILGSSFDKRKFHDNILMMGPAPLHVLEEYIMEWVEEERVLLSAAESIHYQTLTRTWYIWSLLVAFTLLK